MIKFTSIARPVAIASAALTFSFASLAADSVRVASPDPTMGDCRAVQLEQGRAGESALVCETVKPAPKTRKPGRTAVKHIGR